MVVRRARCLRFLTACGPPPPGPTPPAVVFRISDRGSLRSSPCGQASCYRKSGAHTPSDQTPPTNTASALQEPDLNLPTIHKKQSPETTARFLLLRRNRTMNAVDNSVDGQILQGQ